MKVQRPSRKGVGPQERLEVEGALFFRAKIWSQLYGDIKRVAESATRKTMFDAFAKLNRVYESLRKTAKLTAAQNKDAKDNFVDCIGNMVVICEKEGFIPRFATDQPNDLIDKIIQDMNNFTRTFAEDNLNLSNTIDMYLKRIEIQKQLEDKDDNEFTDDDLVAYYEQQEEDAAKDLIEAESDF